jgi:hypothetical protein
MRVTILVFALALTPARAQNPARAVAAFFHDPAPEVRHEQGLVDAAALPTVEALLAPFKGPGKFQWPYPNKSVFG